ncbi:MAG: insulinase family protein [Kangiellaceae bacterium]|nr:insulinase family protein [Kangiellaceae bacterium]
MNNIITLLLAFIISVTLVSCQTMTGVSQNDQKSQLPISNLVSYGQLDNGLTYYLRPNEKPKQRAFITLILNVGSLQEEDHERGVAHFVEHMAFNGSEHFAKDQLIKTLESLGMEFGSDINAFTSFDNTRYLLEIPTGQPENWDTVALILQDWIKGIQFDEQEVKKERGVILSEKRGHKGLGERISDIMTPINFSGARHEQRMPIGTDAVLNTVSSETLQAFHAKWYQPHNMAIIVTGDIKPQPLKQFLNATIGQLKNTNSAKPQKYLIPKNPTYQFRTIQDQEILSTRLQLRYQSKSLTLNNLEALRYRLLNQMMVTLFNQRMFELTDKADKPFDGASLGYSQLGDDRLLFSFNVSPQQDQLEQAYQALFTEIKRVQQHGFIAAERQRYIEDVLKSSALSLQDQDTIHSASLTGSYMNHFLYGDHFLSRQQRHQLLTQELPQISLQELNQHFNNLVNQSVHSLIVYAPNNQQLPKELESNVLTALQKAQATTAYKEGSLEKPLLQQLPEAGSIEKHKTIAAVKAEQYLLSNGVRVIVRPSSLSNTEVLLSAYAAGGYSLADDNNLRSAMESAKLVAASGIGPYSRSELGKKLANKDVRVRLSMDRYFSQLSGSSIPEDLETLFQLIYLYFTAPKIDSDIAKNYRQSVIKYQNNRLNDPEQKYADELHRLLVNNHPRSQPWSVEDGKKIDHQQALSFYKDRFSNASNFTFVIVGNIDLPQLEPLLERYLASLPTGDSEQWIDEGIRTVEKNINFSRDTSLDEKTKVALRYHKPIPQYIADTRFKLGFYTQLLEQQLQQELREELGGVYSVGVSANIQRYPVDWFNLLISFNCDPEREQELLDATQAVVERTLSQPLSADDFANIKQQRKVSFEDGQQSNSFWLGQIYAYERDSIDYFYFTEYLNRLEAVQLDDIQATAKTLFENSYLIKSVMRPKITDEPIKD